MNPVESVLNDSNIRGLHASTAEDVAGSAGDLDEIVDTFSVGHEEKDGESYFVGIAELSEDYSGLDNYEELSTEVEADLFPAFYSMFRTMTTTPPHLGGMDADNYAFAASDEEHALRYVMSDKDVEDLYDRANQGADVENRGRVDGELDMDTLMNEETSMEERFAQEFLREFSENVEIDDL